MIIVSEILVAAPGKREDLKRALLELAEVCRREPGCLQYDIAEPTVPSDEVLVLMQWKTLADLKAHESSTHIQEFSKKYDQKIFIDFHETVWKKLI